MTSPAQPPSEPVPFGQPVPSPFLQEKRALADSLNPPVSAQPSQSLFGIFDPFLRPINNALASLQHLRSSLDLPNPGTSDAFEREVKSIHPANFLFEGARAELTKGLSTNPLFQVTHAFSMGAQSTPSSYNFSSVYGDEKNLFVAGIDDGLNVSLKANHGWVPGHTTKFQSTLSNQPGHTFAQFEHDYQGTDHTALFRAINPSPADGSGIYMVNYLQSLTKNFAFGLETVYQRPSGDLEDVSTCYVAKLTGNNSNNSWSGLLRLRPQGALEAMYLHKLSEHVDFAADLQALAVGAKRDAQATLGARYAFRMAVLRASIDTTGKISSVYETRLSPAFGLTFSGEIDHIQAQSKFGFAISIESGGDLDPNAPPPTPPNMPV